MKLLLICVFCGIALAFTGCDGDSTTSTTTTTKTVDQLTGNEKGALDSLVERIYHDVGAQLIYTTTYNVMPTEDGSFGKKLDTPLVLLSGASVGSRMLEESTLTAIRRKMKSKAVSWKGPDGKQYNLSILEGYLVPDPGGAGGSMYFSNDMVTIVPTKIEVDEN